MYWDLPMSYSELDPIYPGNGPDPKSGPHTRKGLSGPETGSPQKACHPHDQNSGEPNDWLA